MGIAAAAAGVVLVFLVALLINLPRALRQQRNEARQRLLDIKEAAESYSIEVVRTDTAHRLNIGGIHPTMMVHTVEIRNTGRSAQFAVVLDEIEGIFGGSKAFRYLHWADRPGVVSEEIPPGEGRVIESIVTGALRSPNTRKGDKGPFHMFWTVMMSDGTVSDDWTPMGSREDLVVWIRISTRNLPNINYSRRVGLALRPNGIGRLLPERPGDVVITRAPRLDALLDF